MRSWERIRLLIGNPMPLAERDFVGEVSAAALVFQVFVVLYIIFWVMIPPTPEQLAASDPLIQFVHVYSGLWGIPVLCALPAFAWWWVQRPSQKLLFGAVQGSLVALGIVALGLPLLRLLGGPSLPDFIPPEESSRPGLLLGVGAGILEEAVFRLGVLSVLFLLFRKIFPPRWAAVFAIGLTGLAFALSHEIGPSVAPFDFAHFVVRLAIPGCAMSVLFFRPGPSFIVFLHSAAHIGIATLFTGPQ